MKYSKPNLYSIHDAKASAQCIDGTNAVDDGLCGDGAGVSGSQNCSPGVAAGGLCKNGTAPGQNCTSTGNGVGTVCYTGNNPANTGY